MVATCVLAREDPSTEGSEAGAGRGRCGAGRAANAINDALDMTHLLGRIADCLLADDSAGRS